MKENNFDELLNYVCKLPGIEMPVSHSEPAVDLWWLKFSIDTMHPLAWKLVQEIAHVVNYLSVDERLPAIFYPVSPPPYLNGGPDECLSWVIETRSADFTPNRLRQWLEVRLPSPVDDLDEWNAGDAEA